MDLQSMELFKMEPEALDNFLSYGWFRMQQIIFTTDTISFNNFLYNTVWLRIRLPDCKPDKKYYELQKRNARFKMSIGPAIIREEHEKLFKSYKKSVSFETATSLQDLLLGNSNTSVYNTQMINVFDSDKLIGAGFFDLGKNSAAGICSIYDPLYKKYSLGKYMIYEKIMYCINQGFEYFYPGYFVPGYPRFDYKLTICVADLEYFDTNKKHWFRLGQIKSYSVIKDK